MDQQNTTQSTDVHQVSSEAPNTDLCALAEEQLSQEEAAFEAAEALAFWLSALHCVIVWRDGPKRLRPAQPGMRIRDVRAGDDVYWGDQRRTVRSVAVYR